jgi:hypothetical protein
MKLDARNIKITYDGLFVGRAFNRLGYIAGIYTN